ncbi:MAG: conserved protein with predicted RNA binding PUA domain [Candidatus Argoarchaeum ethanivorans]|uniref:Conserved protein with predicted RNA binding PUA domain n=1 Tax=Candidatus Argoarchaeum ethanivorans TaxID=2608793 RepID=A0A8B3S673_9EURY|nr:MAG: conserved protein with predicted RNA binding PUA domain [Candidatus Argoarchaeum ethanivorans]
MTPIELKKIRLIADYQFGRGAGNTLFPEDVTISYSNTRRIRQVRYRGMRLATLKAQDGMFTLGIVSAEKLHRFFPQPLLRVTVNDDAAPFISAGKTTFAKHVIAVDPEIRAGEEILIVDDCDRLLATGKALLAPTEMLCARRGVAVETRAGINSKD